MALVGVGGVYGFVELLVGFAEGGRHGQGVVEVGQRCFGEAGAGVEDGLGCGFDGGALFLAGGLGGCGAGGFCGGAVQLGNFAGGAFVDGDLLGLRLRLEAGQKQLVVDMLAEVTQLVAQRWIAGAVLVEVQVLKADQALVTETKHVAQAAYEVLRLAHFIAGVGIVFDEAVSAVQDLGFVEGDSHRPKKLTP